MAYYMLQTAHCGIQFFERNHGFCFDKKLVWLPSLMHSFQYQKDNTAMKQIPKMLHGQQREKERELKISDILFDSGICAVAKGDVLEAIRNGSFVCG